MNVGVLLCRDLQLEPRLEGGTPVAVIDDLCDGPAAAARALREFAVGRVVLGLCEPRPSPELFGALRRAGAEPFGIEAVMLRGHESEAPRLLAGAVAKLARLRSGERGRPTLVSRTMNRRALFSPQAVLSHAPVALVDEKSCIGARACGLCATACAVGAVDIAARWPTIDESACTACGACVVQCPADALRLSGCAREQVEAQLEPLLGHVSGVVFACSSGDATAPPGWALVELPTLALLTPAWILQARARGTMVALAPCDQACCAGSAAVLELAEILTTSGGEACDAASRSPLHLGEPRGTVDTLLASMPDDQPFTIEHRAAPLGMVELDRDRCTLCGACATACPTDALSLLEDTEAIVLQHQPRACVGCDRCATVCPERALTVRSGIDLSRLRAGTVEAMGAKREHCMVCGGELPPAAMRRRLRQLLGNASDVPPGLCAACASRAVRGPAASAPGNPLEPVGGG